MCDAHANEAAAEFDLKHTGKSKKKQQSCTRITHFIGNHDKMAIQNAKGFCYISEFQSFEFALSILHLQAYKSTISKIAVDCVCLPFSAQLPVEFLF